MRMMIAALACALAIPAMAYAHEKYACRTELLHFKAAIKGVETTTNAAIELLNTHMLMIPEGKRSVSIDQYLEVARAAYATLGVTKLSLINAETMAACLGEEE